MSIFYDWSTLQMWTKRIEEKKNENYVKDTNNNTRKLGYSNLNKSPSEHYHSVEHLVLER